jgi:hypothetical protein
MASVYHINRGVNQPVMFKGLKAQYIWYLGGGFVILMITFAILYICGINMFICLGIIFSAGGVLFKKVYRMSHKYGEHGLMKKIGKRQIPTLIKNNSRDIFIK